MFDDREDKYVARFTNLRMDPFEVSSDLVIHNEKLLVGGIWCIVKIAVIFYKTPLEAAKKALGVE